MSVKGCSHYLNSKGGCPYDFSFLHARGHNLTKKMEEIREHTLSHGIKVRQCDRQRGCGWQFNLKVSLGVWSRHGLMFDSADRQIMSRQRLQYWTRAEIFSTQEVEKCCCRVSGLIFTVVYIDSGLQNICTLWTNVTYKPLKNSYFYYHLNFPLVLLVFFIFWMKQTFYICDLEEGGKKKTLSTSHHRWGAKRLWKPSGEIVSLNWMC